jgi:antitoxin VapB
MITKESSIGADVVEIRKRGDTILLRPKLKSWEPLMESLEKFTDDFMEVRPKRPPLDKRSGLFR